MQAPAAASLWEIETVMAVLISVLDVIISALFTLRITQQYRARRKPYQLIWSVALVIWTVAVLAEAVAALRGAWDPLTYRIYYACGALMVSAWLGVGSLYLVAPPRFADRARVGVFLLSLLGVSLIFGWPINSSDLAITDSLGLVDSELVKIFPFFPIRILIILSNIFGTVAFVGGALYSVYGFWRRQIMRERMLGVMLIAAGGLIAAGAHTIGVLGGPALFRVSELAAISVIFSGFLLSNSSAPTVARSANAPATG